MSKTCKNYKKAQKITLCNIWQKMAFLVTRASPVNPKSLVATFVLTFCQSASARRFIAKQTQPILAQICFGLNHEPPWSQWQCMSSSLRFVAFLILRRPKALLIFSCCKNVMNHKCIIILTVLNKQNRVCTGLSRLLIHLVHLDLFHASAR